jgi:nucleotide-binding universal stress UspA family protein
MARAETWKADLVVLGSKGLAPLEELIVGSTAERVMKEATCSALVTREGRTTREERSAAWTRGAP